MKQMTVTPERGETNEVTHMVITSYCLVASGVERELAVWGEDG